MAKGITTASGVKWMVTDAIQTVQGIFNDIKQNGPLIITTRIREFDITKVNWHEVNYSFILLITAVIGVLTLVLVAQFTEEPVAPGVQPGNRAAGDDGTQKAKQKKGAPPIPPPTEIISLRVYPIKSCRGFEVDSTRLRKSGLTLDRNWMFISTSDRKFLTIRSDPSMTLIDTTVVEGSSLSGSKDGKKELPQQLLEISIHGTDARVTIPAFPTTKWLEDNCTLKECEIWEKETDAYEYGPEINKIFCDFFKKDVALVYKGPSARMVTVNGRKELYGSETAHHFADVMSLQIASEASIKDLNRKLAKKGASNAPLTIERFRPNIIVKGRDEKPWEEDTWKRVRITTVNHDEEAIYKVDLDVVARCARCQVPNVNPDTADKHSKEPWEELMKYRRVDTGGPAKYKPCFGMLCIPKNEGKVQVGATLEVLETTDKHLYNTAKFEDL